MMAAGPSSEASSAGALRLLERNLVLVTATAVILATSCTDRDPRPPTTFSMVHGWEDGRILLTHWTSRDRGLGRFQLLDISIKDEKGNEIPLRASEFGRDKGLNWAWCTRFDEPTSNKVAFEARFTFGCGEYKIKSVLRKKPYKEWFLYDGKCAIEELHKRHGWMLVPEESHGRWIPPGETDNAQ
ncbi:MAG: hypothetical protein AB1696_07740 [Planctomycetota bacterium]